MSQNSSVGIATAYDLDGRGSNPGMGKIFLYNVQMGSEAHPASYPMGNVDNFLGVKQPGRQADHSAPSSAEVKNGGAMPSLTHMSS
jgi:hypothetical protein